MGLGDVVDEFLDDDRLAHAGAAEEPDLPALHERCDEVDDLDAGLEDLGLGLEVDEIGALAVDRPALDACRDLGAHVDRLAEDVEEATECCRAHRDRDRGTSVAHVHAADDRVGGAHRDGADLIATDVLLHLGHHADLLTRLGGRADLERVEELGEVAGFERDVDDRSDDLDDLTDVSAGGGSGSHGNQPWSAEAPPTISAISCVICA